MAAQTNAVAAAAAWAAGMNGAAAKIQAGVQAVTVAPGQKAVQQQQKLLTNFTASVNSGLWAKKTGAVTLQQWQSAMTTKGIPNMGTGVAAAGAKMQSVMTQLLPMTAAISATIQAMPSSTPAQMQARMNANFAAMSALKGKIQATS
jgi:hypothetical protein